MVITLSSKQNSSGQFVLFVCSCFIYFSLSWLEPCVKGEMFCCWDLGWVFFIEALDVMKQFDGECSHPLSKRAQNWCRISMAMTNCTDSGRAVLQEVLGEFPAAKEGAGIHHPVKLDLQNLAIVLQFWTGIWYRF